MPIEFAARPASHPPGTMSAPSNSIIAACLNPPVIPKLDASNGLPSWTLLDTRVYFAHRENPTTAKTETSRGHTIQVSFCFAHPPALSHVCIHCPDLSHANFAGQPHVARSEEQFLLLHLPLNWSTGRYPELSSEYYMYQAIHGNPTLTRIPDPGPGLLLADDLGIYCCGARDYILAGLCPTHDAEGHELHLYSSVSNVWTMKPACLENPQVEGHLPISSHTVIPLGGSLLGWVDLWKGMLVCDVLSEDPEHVLRFIPLPKQLPGNTCDHLCPWKVRDITCTDGSLQFIEIEHLRIPPAVEDLDTIYDSQCFVTPPHHWMIQTKGGGRPLVGWRAIIWNRVLFDNCWRKGGEVHVDDIMVENPSHSTIMDLLPYFPTMSIHGDNVVHINSLMGLGTERRQMISIDMTNKTLKALAPCHAIKLDAYCPYFPCVLSNHLSNTPVLPQVVQASKSENVNAALPQIVQASNSENVTENQHLRSYARELAGAPHRAQSGGSNFNLSLAPQQSFGLLDVTSYYWNHREYPDCTHPTYVNCLQSFPPHPQPIYHPNWPHPHLPSWISSGSVNMHPAYPAFGQMVHPLPLNDCCLFQPPMQRPPEPSPPFNTMSPSVPPTAAGYSVLSSSCQNQHPHSPYGRPH